MNVSVTRPPLPEIPARLRAYITRERATNESSIVLHVDLLVNLKWCLHQRRRVGKLEIMAAVLGGDPEGSRLALRAAAKDEGMRVHTRVTTMGLRAWNATMPHRNNSAVDDLNDA